MRVAIADHLGWAIAVTASADHEVVDRRRIELIEPGLSAAPIHYENRRLDLAATAALVAKVRASVVRATSVALDELAAALPGPVRSISLRAWPLDFPEDIAVQRRAPYEARADAIMYRQELSELAHARGWEVHVYDAKAVVDQAARLLAERAEVVLQGPRATLGPPWTKDHRVALAALAAVGAIAGAVALAANPGAKPHAHAAVADAGAPKTPGSPVPDKTRAPQPGPNPQPLFLNAVERLVDSGTITASGGQAVDREILAGRVDTDTLASSGFTEAQLQAVQQALSTTKRALAASVPRASK